MGRDASPSAMPKRLPMYSLVTANTISLIGSTLTIVAVPWFVLQSTGSASQAGLVGLSAALPRVLMGIFGGTVIDRLGAKRMSVISDAISGLAIAMIPMLHHLGHLAIWPLMGLIFVGNLLNIPGTNARRAIVPELSHLANAKLERVNSAFESIQYLSRLLGAPLAGALIAVLGASNVLWLDATSFLVSALIVAAFVPPFSRAAKTAISSGYWQHLAEGFRFLRRDRLLLWMAVALMLFNPLSLALGPVFLPVYANRVLGSATDLGLLSAAIGAGGVIGSFVYGTVGHRFPRRTVWLIPFIVGPIQYWGLLAQPSLPLAMVILLIDGIAFGPFNVVMATVKQEHVPLELRGRVFSLFSAITLSVQPIGVALAGFAVDTFGFNPALLMFASVLEAIGVALLFVPVLRTMNLPQPGMCLKSNEF